MSHRISRAAALVAVCLPALAAAAPLSFEQALDLAVQRSEALRAARAGVASAGEAAQAAGQLPDPLLRVGVENLPATGPDRFSTTRDGQTMKRIGISQEWLSPAKRAARQAAADAGVDREAVQVQAAAAEARLQAALAYVDAWYAWRLRELTTRTQRQAEEAFEVARARVGAAAGSPIDALTLDAARGLAADDTAELQQVQDAAQRVLERWTGVLPDTLAAVPPMAVPSEAAYVEASAAVLAGQREREAARRAVVVAAAERQPNWSWELSYGQRTGAADMVSLGVSVPLQLAPAARQDRETASRRALVERAEAVLAEATRAAVGEYRALAGDARHLDERIERLGSSALAPARQRSAAALAAYRANQAPLASVFEARQAELDLQRKLLTLQRDRDKIRAQLALKPLTIGAAP